MRYIFPKWTAEGAGNCGELSPHSILQRRAYVSCRGCVGISPSAWGHAHEVRVAPRIKGQILFVLDRREFFCRGRFSFPLPRQKSRGSSCFTGREKAMKIRPTLDEVSLAGSRPRRHAAGAQSNGPHRRWRSDGSAAHKISHLRCAVPPGIHPGPAGSSDLKKFYRGLRK